MEFNEVVVKENLGLCRCCLSEGCYKDVCTEYTWMNETEIYAEMLMDCFDISIMQHSDGPNGASRLICEVCITRLRDACNFKKQVQETEKKFIDMISKGEFQPKALQEMKSEVEVEVEPETENTVNAEYLEDEMDFSEAVKEDSDSDYEQPGVSRAATPPKKKRLKKIKIEPPKKGSWIIKKKSTNSQTSPGPTLKRIKKETKGVLVINKKKSRVKATKHNLTTIMSKLLELTSAMPFKWDRAQKYLCFHCPEMFPDSADYRIHYRTEHVTPKLDKTSAVFGGDIFLKVDTTNFSCKACCQPMANLRQFFAHASETHDLHFKDEYKNKFIEFRLNDKEMKCIECGLEFKFFSPLLRHMHKEHHGDDHAFVCNYCGRRCNTKASMKSHIMHHHQNHYCKKCDKKFETHHHLQQHIDTTHKSQKLKCPQCSEVFPSRFLKNKHIALVHDEKSIQFPCDHCSKMFSSKSAKWVHVRRVHLKEKTSSCDICGHQAFNDCAIRRHKAQTHNEARPHQCNMCDKAYKERRHLTKHVTKYHPSDMSGP